MSEPGKAANTHEAQVKALCNLAMGAPFLFFPDRRGRNSQQVCDLAFATGEVVIVMEITEQIVGYDDDDNATKTRECIFHNLKNLKGMMRLWKQKTVILSGGNDYARFSIPYSPDLRVATLSIIRCKSGVAEWHVPVPGASLSVTLPQSFLELLFSIGGTVFDIVTMALPLHTFGSIPENDFLELIKITLGTWQKQAELQRYWPGEKLGIDYLRIVKYLSIGMRMAGIAAKEKPLDAVPYHLFADIPMVDVYRLVASLKTAAIAAMSVRSQFSEILKLSGYHFAISTIPDFDKAHLEAAGHCADTFFSDIQNGTARYGPHMLAVANPGSSVGVQDAADNLGAYCRARKVVGFRVVILTIASETVGTPLGRFHLAAVCYPPNPPRSNLARILDQLPNALGGKGDSATIS